MALVNDGAVRTDVCTSLNPKEMQQAYEIRAALEEVGRRAAAQVNASTAEGQKNATSTS